MNNSLLQSSLWVGAVVVLAGATAWIGHTTPQTEPAPPHAAPAARTASAPTPVLPGIVPDTPAADLGIDGVPGG